MIKSLKDKVQEKVKSTSSVLNRLKIEAKDTYNVLKAFVSPVESEDSEIVKYAELAPYPIVLVHGYMSGADCWDDFIPLFEQLGYILGKNLFNFAYSNEKCPAKGDCVEYATHLSQTIEEILTTTALPKVILVVHSMGGLISRYYMELLNGADKVHKLIMLGTPNRGSGPLPEIREMYTKIEKGFELKINEIKVLMGKPVETDKVLLGVAGEQLKPNSSLLEKLGFHAKPNYYLIAGTKGLPKILKDPNDGAVELISARLEGLNEDQVKEMFVNHFELHKSLKVFNQMMKFVMD
jgi:pimeloyl-ACP methyl ester carboxylesterase